MLHELVFLGCHSQFALYPYTFAPYSYICEILQPYVAAAVRTRSDAVLSSTRALLMKTVKNNYRQQQIIHAGFCRIWLPDTCESAFTCYNSAKPPETSKIVRICFPLDAQVYK